MYTGIFEMTVKIKLNLGALFFLLKGGFKSE